MIDDIELRHKSGILQELDNYLLMSHYESLRKTIQSLTQQSKYSTGITKGLMTEKDLTYDDGSLLGPGSINRCSKDKSLENDSLLIPGEDVNQGYRIASV